MRTILGRLVVGGSYATASYMMRRRWDYVVRWLMGVEPPKV